MREPRGERRPVIENVLGLVLGALQLGLEGLYLRPQLEDRLLVFGEGEVLPFAHFIHGGSGERVRETERIRVLEVQRNRLRTWFCVSRYVRMGKRRVGSRRRSDGGLNSSSCV